MNRATRYHTFTLIALVLLAASSVAAQTRGTSVTVNASVSGTVALSIPPNTIHDHIHSSVVSSGNSVLMTLSDTDARSRVLRVPLIVRSNSDFRISAEFESNTAVLTQLSVVDVRATGTLVSPLAVNGVDVARPFDRRGSNEDSVTSYLPLEVSHPLLLLIGPRVSLGGTLDSPHNALEITLLIHLQSQTGQRGSINLRFVGTATNDLPGR